MLRMPKEKALPLPEVRRTPSEDALGRRAQSFTKFLISFVKPLYNKVVESRFLSKAFQAKEETAKPRITRIHTD